MDDFKNERKKKSMREILFRGQTRRYGEKVNMVGEKLPSNWVYGGVFHQNDRDGSFSIIYSYDPIEKRTVYADTVGQYTGLKDKNGKKIFEGDIVKTSKYGKDDNAGHNFSGPDCFVVKWRKCSFVLENKYRCFNLRPVNTPDDEMEIIGNIHDNPELLK